MTQNFNLLLFISPSYYILCVEKWGLFVLKERRIFRVYSNCFHLPKHSFWNRALRLIHRYFILQQGDFSHASVHMNPWIIFWFCLLVTFSGHFMCKPIAISFCQITLLQFCSLKLHFFQTPSSTLRDMLFLKEESLNTNAPLLGKLVESTQEGDTLKWSTHLLKWDVLCFFASCL